MSSNHTPTPWDFCDETTENDNFARTIYGPRMEYDALAIARVDQNGTRNDAAFIVRACNTHDALVEALHAIIQLDHHNMGPESQATKMARAALKLAGEA